MQTSIIEKNKEAWCSWVHMYQFIKICSQMLYVCRLQVEVKHLIITTYLKKITFPCKNGCIIDIIFFLYVFFFFILLLFFISFTLLVIIIFHYHYNVMILVIVICTKSVTIGRHAYIKKGKNFNSIRIILKTIMTIND